jgi:hypothetical protein
MLGLNVMPTGGPALEAFATRGDPHRYDFTMPLSGKATCDFSYSGLKSAVRLSIEEGLGGNLGCETEQVLISFVVSALYARHILPPGVPSPCSRIISVHSFWNVVYKSVAVYKSMARHFVRANIEAGGIIR